MKRVILDESVPKQVGDHLPGHSVTTVPIEGWASVKNGKLLALIEEKPVSTRLSLQTRTWRRNNPFRDDHLRFSC